MRLFTISLFSILFFFPYALRAQQNPVFKHVVDKLDLYERNNAPEKTYVKTDKDNYINGETIWYKTFLVNGSNMEASDKSNVIYVELLNAMDSTIAQQKLFSSGLGADGSIVLPETIAAGTYRLRAFTKYMLNEQDPVFHTKKLNIMVPRDTVRQAMAKKKNKPLRALGAIGPEKPLIAFYPEGGDLVSGLQNGLGLKVTDSNGNGIALKGHIIDGNHKVIAPFESHDFGLSKTTFIPEANTDYFAQIMVNGKEERYPLPQVLGKGYVLRSRNAGEFLVLQVATNLPGGLKETMLLGHVRGKTFFERVESSDEASYSVKIPTETMNDGVAHFTLFTAAGEPVCERLVFVDNPYNDLAANIVPDKPSYTTREKVTLDIAIKDVADRAVPGSLVASVVSSNSLEPQAGSSIKSWLLLNSDVGGTVPNPNFFFEDVSPKKEYLLDVLMLTHGWRRFVWEDVLTRKVSKALLFEPEKGIMIEGRTTSYTNKRKPKPANLRFKVMGEEVYSTSGSTNAQGHFSFGPFIFQDSVRAYVTAEKLTAKRTQEEDEVAIHLHSDFPSPLTETPVLEDIKTLEHKGSKAYMDQAYRHKVATFGYDPRVIQLEEATVKSPYQKTRQDKIDEQLLKHTIHGEPDVRIFKDSVPWSNVMRAIDLLRVVPGVFVNGDTVTIRGGSSLLGPNAPLILLDGFQIGQEILANMMANEIMFVDVLKGASTAIYGMRGGNGVIAFYTWVNLDVEAPNEASAQPGLANIKINGFHKKREFYSPRYNPSEPDVTKADYRTTLHWAPNLQYDPRVPTTIDFFTGDAPGTYVVNLEGIAPDGRLIRASKSFTVVE
ncbi:TonB-dependent receptor plug domain-containing protein [Maribacter sp. 2307ULW6-5]|uniref:TonB-dependent receptor plug domain-containing protein n=1 Tax=Maribacter sp. 2307ULW6-5 TaxID=3386275 RepID=UPI0039BCF98C